MSVYWELEVLRLTSVDTGEYVEFLDKLVVVKPEALGVIFDDLRIGEDVHDTGVI